MESRFIGKTCPYCKTPFRDGDTIVTCSVCEMPHHLSCWQENNGCTTFGCTGTIKETFEYEETSRGEHPATIPVPHHAEQRNNTISATPVRQNNSDPTGRFETLFEAEPMAVQSNIPVLTEKLALIIDHESNTIVAHCTFRSLTSKPILALLVDVICADVWGNPTTAIKGFQYLDLKTGNRLPFGQTTGIPIPDSSTRSIDVIIRKLLYEDHSVIEGTDEKYELPRQVSLEDFFKSKDLVDEYVRETTPLAKFTPAIGKDYWRCVCGAINPQTDSVCYRCRSELSQISRLLNANIISEILAERKEQQRIKAEKEKAEREEQLRQAEERLRKEKEEKEQREREAEEALRWLKEKRKKKTKKIILSIAILLFVAFLGYATIWHAIPYIKYTKAEKALEAKNYDAAYAGFIALGDFSDSSERATHVLYSRAVDLMYSGEYIDAAKEFDDLGNYMNSKELAEECRNTDAYLKAIDLYEAEKYQDAVIAFTALDGFKDSKEYIKKSNYAYANKLLSSGRYEEAIPLFAELGAYADSKELAKESSYQAGRVRYDNGEFHDAFELLNPIRSYKDAAEIADEAEYLYANEQFDAGNYVDSYQAFLHVKEYKDVPEKMPEATYQYALSLMDNSEWEKAYKLFVDLGNYRDSTSRYKESYYQYGIQLLDQSKYKDAVTVFSELGWYQQSATKLNDAKYGYVVAHKNNTDTTTYSYLKDLKAAWYKDSADIYKELYSWKAKLTYFNTSSNNTSTISSSISRSCTYLHYGFELTGGPPGETVTISSYTVYPDGNVGYMNDSWKDARRGYNYSCYWDSGIYQYPAYGATGTLTERVYIVATGEVIGEFTIKVTS